MDEITDHESLPFLFHSGELPAEARAGFQAHLGGCADCRAALEGLDWAADLSRAAAVAGRPALASRALRRAFATPAASWSWPDWARSAGMGLGLAFAVGLFLVRSSSAPAEALWWHSGLAPAITELGGRLENLDTDLSLESWNAEFNEGWDELDRSRQGLQSQLAQPEGV